MCGIYGYLGKRNGVKIALDGLRRIEYRGYDSAGLACVIGSKIEYVKDVGKISVLESMAHHLVSGTVIAHTRWATHGKITKENAHPHFDEKECIAVIHNGIIENHEILRKKLQEEGVHFRSDTDAEVIPHLIAKFYEGDLLKAVQQSLLLLHGAYAIAVIHKQHPEEIVVAAHGCPLVVGVGVEELFFASDSNALLHHTREVLYLADGEVAQLCPEGMHIFDASMIKISKKSEQLLHSVEEASKGTFEHFTIKEIFEQPQTIRNAMQSRFSQEYGTVSFEGLNFEASELLAIKRILIIAAGTSWHAGFAASYMIEDQAGIPCQLEIASEFRYKNPVIPDDTLVIVISQSGETADTIAAMREIKARGAKVVAICNVQGSTIAREADCSLFLHAGQEVGVCSTKAFTSQLVVLSLFCLLLARMRHMSKLQGQAFFQALQKLPDQVQQVLDKASLIQGIAEKYNQYNDFFFIGRRYMFPTALEGALKLKEIAYVNANGYAAGELKHGPIALINGQCPTVALVCDKVTYNKLLSNLMEVKARHGKILVVAPESAKHLERVADDIIAVPETLDELAPIVVSVALQLFAYFFAYKRGAEIDKPRNLAKSVTVE